ncbi:hypothetical protein P879_09798 [Paragonimus westermani]|uniref:Uncharacterized protein n=1 Tax=Paragonimus westermani TaxID=34504 RepID=A0A8T0D321_9TREM|nr:hypothetical protein P879_09798 [Paragonimus westermani]
MATYKRRRKDAASTIPDSRWRNAHLDNDYKFEGFSKYWRTLLMGKRINDMRPPSALLPCDHSLAAAISTTKVTRALNNLSGLAPGPDWITPRDLRKYRVSSVATLFNSYPALSPIL